VYQVIRNVPDNETLIYGKLYRLDIEVGGFKRLTDYTQEEWRTTRDNLYVELAQSDLHLEDLVIVDPYNLYVICMYVGHSIIAIMICIAVIGVISAIGLKIMNSSLVEVKEIFTGSSPVIYAGLSTAVIIAIVIGLIFLPKG